MSSLYDNRIYLDHAATTPLDAHVRDAMLPYLSGTFGNPSSLHYLGRQAKKALDAARATTAVCLGVQPEEIVFTSGATEANNWVISGVPQALQHRGRHIITTQIEHASVTNACKRLEAQGWEVTWLPVDSEGFVSFDALKDAVRPDTVLVSIMHGNNEIGTIQPIVQFGQYLREWDVPFHVDAVQTVGKMPLSLANLPVDYVSISGHKLYGPKGVGALYISNGAPKPAPLLVGGAQESDLRAGTENLPAIVGLAKALEVSLPRMSSEIPRLRLLQKYFIRAVQREIPSAVLNGPQDVAQRVLGHVNFSFPPGEGEALVLHLDLKGIAVSSGSACHSAIIEPSRVVKALGKPDDVARSTVRFSMGHSTHQGDLDRVLAVLPGIVQRARQSSPQAMETAHG